MVTNIKYITSVLISTIILFLWNAMSWMVLPFRTDNLINIPDNAFQQDSLKKHITIDGVYHYPGIPDNSAESINTINEKLNSGPRITMMVYKSGPTELFSPIILLYSFVFNLLTAFLSIYILTKLTAKNKLSIIVTSVIIGLIICVAEILPTATWYLFPLDYIIIEIFDTILAFALTGIFFSLYTFKGVSK